MNDMIVDANSLFARSWFAAKRMEAEPVEAISLMVRTLCLLLNPDSFNKLGVRFDRTLLAWDGKQNPLKNRDDKPPEYHDTKAAAMDVMEYLFGTVNFQHLEYEGDDIVATAVFASGSNDTCYVVSADKDLQQLQGPRAQYYCLNTKALLSRAFITHKWNIERPSQVALALAIIGDPVDNIAGIKGWGPVKCKQLFEAVTPKMNFEQALEALVEQMPEDKLEQFYAALDRTLLKTDVPGVPRPARLKLATPKEARRLGVPNIGSLYERLYAAYVTD